MKKNIQLPYIGIALLLVILLDLFLINGMRQKEVQTQTSIESKMPSGNYLPDSENPLIRVVIKNNGFKEITHNEVQVCAENGLIIAYGKDQIEIMPGEVFSIAPGDLKFQNGNILIETKVETDRIEIRTLSRGCGIPSYRGIMELFSTAEGIVIVNEIPLEEYLYAVVPSEMPASYESEALKCQAICARSYAYCQMFAFAYPEYSAHVDDSTSFQVYGNSREQESTRRALQETAGEKLYYKNQVIKTYYYSTSCGHSTSVEAWGTELTDENAYLQGGSLCDENGKAYEEELPWFRWKAVISKQTLENLIELNAGKEIGTLQDVSVTKVGVGGIALQIVAKGTKGSITVDTENKIRKVLGGSGYKIEKQDGTVIESTKLLPSAFFSIEKNGKNYIIKGGGYGHGIGMSQNGAQEMAKDGINYKEILQIFYPGTEVK